jgi:hypothetical protein
VGQDPPKVIFHLLVAFQARSLTPWKVSTKFHHFKVIGTGCKFTSVPQGYREVPPCSLRTIGQDPPKVTCAHPLVALQARSLTPWKVYTKFPYLKVIGTAWNFASIPSPSKRVVLLSLRTIGQDPPKVTCAHPLVALQARSLTPWKVYTKFPYLEVIGSGWNFASILSPSKRVVLLSLRTIGQDPPKVTCAHPLVAFQARSLTPWKVYTKFPYLKPIGTGCKFTSVPQGYREVPPCSLRTIGQDPPKVTCAHPLVAFQARSLTPWKVSKKFHHFKVIGTGCKFTSVPQGYREVPPCSFRTIGQDPPKVTCHHPLHSFRTRH